MKTKFIVNPFSGIKKHKNIRHILEKNLDINRFKYDIEFTEKQFHAKEIAKKAVLNKYDLIICVGGDGTLNEITSELIGTDVAVGILPAGSGNGFAFHNGIEKNITNAIKQLNKSVIRKVDSGNVNGKSFVNVSGIGFDAHIANLFSKLEKRGFKNYIKLILQELNYKAQKYTIEYENKQIELEAILISFANASQYGNNFKISPNSNITDGKLDFVLLKNIPKWKIPLLLIKIAIGQANKSKYIEIIRTKKMIVKTTEKIIHLDGESVQINTDLEINCIKKSLFIFAPNEKK
tara:strand:- start:47190 stop:48065 length:876 start_codon:yes stop_codon:yes gene_type:complete